MLNRLEAVLQQASDANQILLQLAKPMRDKLDINEHIKEQDFKGVDKDKMNHLIEKSRWMNRWKN